MTEALTEAYTLTNSLSRQRSVAATVAELESVTAALSRLKLVAYVIQQTEGNTFFVNRARKCVVPINEVEAVQASFNRARAYVLPVAETEDFTLNFARLREQAVVIAETQGLATAIQRIREVVQSIANSTDLTFRLSVPRGEPHEVHVVVSWQEWENVNGVLILKNRSENLVSFPKTRSTQVVVEATQSIVFFSDAPTSSMHTVTDEIETFVVVPTNAL